MEELGSNSHAQLQQASSSSASQSAGLTAKLTLSTWVLMFLSLLKGVPPGRLQSLFPGLLTQVRSMQLQVLLPCLELARCAEAGIYDEVPAVRWLLPPPSSVEDFLPFTCGHTFTHIVSQSGGKLHLEEKHGSEVQGRGRCSLHGLKILISRTREEVGSSSSLFQWNLFPRQPGREPGGQRLRRRSL